MCLFKIVTFRRKAGEPVLEASKDQNTRPGCTAVANQSNHAIPDYQMHTFPSIIETGFKEAGLHLPSNLPPPNQLKNPLLPGAASRINNTPTVIRIDPF